MKKLTRFFSFAFICTAILLCFDTGAYAQQQKRTVKVAFVPQPTIFEVDKEGNMSGYSYEYIMQIAQHANWDVEFVMAENGDINQALLEMMDKVQNKEVDLIGSVLHQESLESIFEYPKYYYGNVYTTLVSSVYNEQIDPTNLLTKGHLNIAVYKNATLRVQELKKFLALNDISYTLIETQTDAELVQLLENGEADVALAVSISTPVNTQIVAQFANRPYFFVTAKGRTDITNEMDKAIAQIAYTQPQYTTELYNKYYLQNEITLKFTLAEQKFIKDQDKIKVLVPYNLPPLQHYGQNLPSHGVYISFIKYLSAKTGLEFEIENYDQAEKKYGEDPWKHYDIVLGLPQNADAAIEYNMVHSAPILKTMTVLYYNRNVDIKDLTKLTMAQATSGDNKHSVYEDIKEYKTIYECVKAVNDGKADFGYGADLIVNYEVNSQGYKNVSVAPILTEEKSYVLGYNHGTSPELISIVNRVIRTIDSKELNSFMSDSIYIHDESLLSAYLKKNPLVMVLSGVIALAIVVMAVMMWISLKKSGAKNLELIKANNQKSDFLSNMSHEMRTPMNAIMGITEIAMDEREQPNAIKDYLLKIQASSHYLMGLINDILDMAKIESGSFSLNLVKCNTFELYDSIEHIIAPLAEEKGVNFIFNRPEKARCLMVDPIRFNQIFLNLLTNAVKFTEKDGTVYFTITNSTIKNNCITSDFIIKDTGVGISKNFQKHMFEPFMQENGFESTHYQRGTGLGLPIVKKIVELVGGTIECESDKNKGTTFKLTITSPIAMETVEILPENAAEKQEIILSGKKVLIVEDHPLNIEVAKKLLQRKGMEVQVALNGQIAVDIIQQAQKCEFDLILMDIRMPVMDGITATKLIRASGFENTKQVPIVAMSANAFEDDIKVSINAGINEHLAKPISAKLFYKTIENLLE